MRQTAGPADEASTRSLRSCGLRPRIWGWRSNLRGCNRNILLNVNTGSGSAKRAPGARPKRGAKLLAGLGESSTKHVFTKTAVVVGPVTGDVGVGSKTEAAALQRHFC